MSSSSYRLRNWPEYEQALESRGRITLFFSPEILARWRAEASPKPERGHPKRYSDEAITALLLLKEHFHMAFRDTVGLARSLFSVLGIALPIPDHTTLSRRRRRLPATLPVSAPAVGDKPLHLIIDSTGVQLVGEGSWRQHRWGDHARLTWIRHYLRVHVAVDAATGELRALGVSSMSVTDGEMLPQLLAAVSAPLTQVTGDGAYDTWRCYDAVAARPEHPCAVFPPKRGQRRARIKRHGNCHAPRLDRDEHIRRIRQIGRRRWKQEVGYHRRSLAETFCSRWKRRFGDRLTARTFDGQCTEVFMRGAVLNRLLWLGRPESCRV
jgi:Transposase DDE domain